MRVVRAHPDLHPGIGLGVHVDSSCVAVEVRVLEDSVLLVVTHRDKVVDLFGRSVHGEDVLRAQGGVVADLVHPVFVPRGDSVILDLAGALVDEG